MTDIEPAHIDIDDAKANLSQIIERVERGDEIVISRAGTPVAKVVPLRRAVARVARGSLAGSLVLSDDWDSPDANESIADDFRTER